MVKNANVKLDIAVHSMAMHTGDDISSQQHARNKVNFVLKTA